MACQRQRGSRPGTHVEVIAIEGITLIIRAVSPDASYHTWKSVPKPMPDKALRRIRHIAPHIVLIECSAKGSHVFPLSKT